jgi:hypothetical protein
MNELLMFMVKVAVCSEICTKYINAMSTIENFLMLNLVVRKVTARL